MHLFAASEAAMHGNQIFYLILKKLNGTIVHEGKLCIFSRNFRVFTHFLKEIKGR